MSVRSFIDSPYNKPAPIIPTVLSLVNLRDKGEEHEVNQLPANNGETIGKVDIVVQNTDPLPAPADRITLTVPAGTYNLAMFGAYKAQANVSTVAYAQLVLLDTVSSEILTESSSTSYECSNVDFAYCVFNHEQLIRFTEPKTVTLQFWYSNSNNMVVAFTEKKTNPTGYDYNPRAIFTKVPDEPSQIIPTF